jgi:hypothetical protein
MRYMTTVAEEYRSPDDWIANRGAIVADIILSYVFRVMNIRWSTRKGSSVLSVVTLS